MGALVFVLLARPPLRTIRRRDVPVLLALGIITGLEAIAVLASIGRIPLGTAVAIEFLGPLAVAAVRRGSAQSLPWPAVALVGVILLTEPWHGEVNVAGITFAGFAGVGWAAYILLTQQIGDRFGGIGPLSITVAIAAVTTAVAGIPQAAGHLTLGVIFAAAGLTILLPVLPFALELLALRQMTHTAFGTLMALEPAFGVFLGLLVLHQRPSTIQVVGVLLVVIAGAAAQYRGRRQPPSVKRDDAPSNLDFIGDGARCSLSGASVNDLG
jgi:inner membrane transporter RhtA